METVCTVYSPTASSRCQFRGNFFFKKISRNFPFFTRVTSNVVVCSPWSAFLSPAWAGFLWANRRRIRPDEVENYRLHLNMYFKSYISTTNTCLLEYTVLQSCWDQIARHGYYLSERGLLFARRTAFLHSMINADMQKKCRNILILAELCILLLLAHWFTLELTVTKRVKSYISLEIQAYISK